MGGERTGKGPVAVVALEINKLIKVLEDHAEEQVLVPLQRGSLDLQEHLR